MLGNPLLLDQIDENRLMNYDQTNHCPTFVRTAVEPPAKPQIKLTFRYHSPANVHKFAHKLESVKWYFTSPISVSAD